jgi:DNA replication and repair protein RecF
MITDIRLQSFRSYDDASFEVSPSVNIIVGPNASGKTNLLEAILVLARGGSYRVRDGDLIEFDRPWARLDAHTDSGDRVLKLIREPSQTVFEIDGQIIRRLTAKYRLPVVLFEPTHLQLLSGSPELRRSYLDELLDQLQPGYRTTLRHYQRTLAQRNALLKLGADRAAPQLFPWNIRLSELAGTIVKKRVELIDTIGDAFTALYTELSETDKTVSMEYLPMFSVDRYETHMLHRLEVDLDVDCARGFTASGPHREDFQVLFDGHVAAETASRGEARTAVLALKVLELQQLEQLHGQPPLLLLDDVFSELDGSRRRLLTKYIEPYQSFITTTDADVVLKHFLGATTIIPLG